MLIVLFHLKNIALIGEQNVRNHEVLPILYQKVGSYSDGWGEVTGEDRTWEQSYRDRWAHDKIVRSTHGVNCTGSCSWQVYVKDGIVVWETQETDYPPTPAGVPNHEPAVAPEAPAIPGTSTLHPE